MTRPTRQGPRLQRVAVMFSPDDFAIVEALKRVTGISTLTDIVRASLRAHYLVLTGEQWHRSEAAKATGTEG